MGDASPFPVPGEFDSIQCAAKAGRFPDDVDLNSAVG